MLASDHHSPLVHGCDHWVADGNFDDQPIYYGLCAALTLRVSSVEIMKEMRQVRGFLGANVPFGAKLKNVPLGQKEANYVG